MEQLLKLYQKWRGQEPAHTEKLPGAGSNRAYYRLSDKDGQSVIGCVGTSRDENHAFIYLAQHFTLRRLPVPKVLAVSDDELRYLQSDLGSTSLFDAISGGRKAGGRYTVAEQQLLRRTIRELPNIQFRGARGLDFSHCYPQPDFNVEGVLFDLNYFKYCFLKATEVDFHEMKLEADFRLLAKDLTTESSDSFLYRDFQARNVMLVGEDDPQPFFIDFQGGRRGPFYYDLASFLWQASAQYPDKLRHELIDEYYEAAQQFTEMPKRDLFDSRLRLFVFFRTLQVLGAYGFRGYFEKKPDFMKNSIVPAVANLRKLVIGKPFTRYPYLSLVIDELVNLKDFVSEDKGLTVRVMSFAYKKGIPHDPSGNGGGFVFDCRALNNPGKYDKYKAFTGLDQNVIEFLQKESTIDKWLEHVYALVDESVERYVNRKFTDLMVCFGCTGGQHRSVYAAEHLAEHIHEKFNVRVELSHREQPDHERTLNPIDR